MPLALSLKPGEMVKIGETEFTLDRLMENGDFVLTSDGEAFHIVEERYTEVLPDVLMAVGRIRAGRAKLMIEAPREIEIERPG